MKIKDIILKKAKLYTNEKYFILFSELLENVPNLILEKSKEKKLIFDKNIYNKDDLSNIKDNKLLIKIKTDKYWNLIKKNFFSNIFYNKRYYSQMEFNYISFLAKTTYSKLITISLENNEIIERIIEIYIKMCKKEMKKKLLIQQRKLQRLLEIENEKKGIKRKKTFFKKQVEEEESDEDELNSKKKVVNLFIGRFDVEKFFNKEQVIEFKQGSFVNAFIFKDKSNTENKIETKHNNREITVYKNKKNNNNNNKKNVLSSPNLNENIKNANNTHRFGSLSYINANHKPFMLLNKTKKINNKKLNISIKEENSLENTKEEKFDKKKLIFNTQSNSSNKHSNNQKNNLDKNLFLKTLIRNNKNSNKLLSKETLKTYNTINTMSITKRMETDYYLPNIFDNDFKLSLNKKMNKNKILNFLKKKDFYY